MKKIHLLSLALLIGVTGFAQDKPCNCQTNGNTFLEGRKVNKSPLTKPSYNLQESGMLYPSGLAATSPQEGRS